MTILGFHKVRFLWHVSASFVVCQLWCCEYNGMMRHAFHCTHSSIRGRHYTSLYEKRWVVTYSYVDISGFTRPVHLVLGSDAQFATKTAL